MIRAKIFLLLGVVFLLCSILFIGVFYDRHTDCVLFLKHQPTFKFTFYPSFWSLPDISPAERRKENALYQEFIIDTKAANPGSILSVPAVLVQSMLTYSLFGFLPLYLKRNMRLWKPAIHFLLCFIITSVGMELSAFVESPVLFFFSIGFSVVFASILMRNYPNNKTLKRFKKLLKGVDI